MDNTHLNMNNVMLPMFFLLGILLFSTSACGFNVSNVLLTSEDGTNTTLENLSSFWVTSGPPGTRISNITDWRINGTSMAVMNIPFESDGSGVIASYGFENNLEDSLGNYDGLAYGTVTYDSNVYKSGSYSLKKTNSDGRINFTDALIDELSGSSSWEFEWFLNLSDTDSNQDDIFSIGDYIITIYSATSGCGGDSIVIWDGGAYTCAGTYDQYSKWAKVKFLWDGTNVKFYLNDVLKGTRAESVNQAFGSAFMPTSYQGWNNVYYIDDVNVSRTKKIKDYSTNNLSGSNFGATWTSSGYLGGAYEFDGIDDYIYVDADLDMSSYGEFTLSFWEYQDIKFNDKGVVSIGLSATDGTPCVLAQAYDTATRFYIEYAWRLPITYNIDAWNHITLRYNGTTWEAFHNGVSAGTYEGGHNEAYCSATEDVYIGSGFNGYFNGTIDEVKIYSRDLSNEQILLLNLSHYNMIASQETSPGETWSVAITPNDGKEDGVTVISNDLIINTINIVAPLKNSTYLCIGPTNQFGVIFGSSNATLCQLGGTT